MLNLFKKASEIIGKYLINALKGFAMGAANVVPGVSGGTIALITGIFGKLIGCLNDLMTPSKWKSIDWGFLISLAAGLIISIFSLAKLITVCLDRYPVLTWAFFFGLILVSAGLMLKDIKGWKIRDAIITIIGIAIGVIVCTLSPSETTDARWFIFLCGALAICSMILPGISGSFILVILGKYDYIMAAITELDIPVLIVFAIGCGVGILAFAKILHWLLGKYERSTMLVLIGFVIGSLVKVWPWQGLAPGADLHIPGAIICCVAGIALLLVIEFLSKRSR